MATASRRLAAAATDAACRTLGRRAVARAARYVLRLARLDYPNEMTVNGGEIHVADVGANVGRWSLSMLSAASAPARAYLRDAFDFLTCLG